MHHTFMHAHTPTHNLWLWPKRRPLAFSVAETSVAEMSGQKRPGPKCPWPKCPTFVVLVLILITDLCTLTFTEQLILFNVCQLLIISANSLVPDQARHNVGPDLDPKLFDSDEAKKKNRCVYGLPTDPVF